MPVGLVGELEATPSRSVRVLGEDLVLYKDKSGGIGLLAERCAHEGAMLSAGWVERRGIVCPSHRWIFDAAGNCFIVPGAPPGSPCHPTVRQVAYPVQEDLGLYWAYLGPLPAPRLPRDASWLRRDGPPPHIGQSRLAKHWLEALEPSSDDAGPDTLLPNVVWSISTVRIYVPIDDAQTLVYVLEFQPAGAASC